MVKNILKYAMLLVVLGFSQNLLAKEVVVLVPGFFNSFAPEYFSEDVINSFKKQGFQVYVASGLNPVGHIEENGSRLEGILADIEKNENHHVAFNIVAHSAGGFYTMWVANRQKFEIKNIFAVATPFKGVEFVEVWRSNPMFKALMDLAHLESLDELTPAGAAKFIASVRISPKTRMVAYGGFQDAGWDIADARNLSVPLRVSDHFITGKSDGVVGFSSAMGIGNLMTTEEKPAQQFRNSGFNINLEHWEQVLDYRSFIFLGILNTGYIRNEQIRFYSGLAGYMQQLTK